MINYTVNFKRLPHQKRFNQSKALTKALITGFGGGKTIIGAHEIIKHSAIDNGIPHMGVSPSYQMAKKTIIPSIMEVLEEHYNPPILPGTGYKYNKSDHIFKIKPWNGIIYVGSADNPDSLKGPNLGSFWLDEPGLMGEQAYKFMLSRRRHPKAKHLQGCLTGTPEGLNWLYDVCEGDKIPKDFELIRGKTTDNYHLPQSFIDDLFDQYDEQLVKAYINGLFVNLMSGSAYYSYSDTENIIDEYEPDLSKPLLIGMDFNYDPMCSIIGQETTLGGNRYLVIFDEFYLRNCDTDASCERIINKYGVGCKYIIYPDPSCYNRSAHGAAKSDIKLIKNTFVGLDYAIASGAQKRVFRKDRLTASNKILKNAKGVRKTLILKSVRHLREDLRKITMEEYLNSNYDDPMLGHASDAFGYLAAKRYPVVVNKAYQNTLTDKYII
jgi:hypothetical protein